MAGLAAIITDQHRAVDASGLRLRNWKAGRSKGKAADAGAIFIAWEEKDLKKPAPPKPAGAVSEADATAAGENIVHIGG